MSVVVHGRPFRREAYVVATGVLTETTAPLDVTDDVKAHCDKWTRQETVGQGEQRHWVQPLATPSLIYMLLFPLAYSGSRCPACPTKSNCKGADSFPGSWAVCNPGSHVRAVFRLMPRAGAALSAVHSEYLPTENHRERRKHTQRYIDRRVPQTLAQTSTNSAANPNQPH